MVSFDQSNNTGAITVKMDGPVFAEKSSFKILGLIFFSKLDWGSYIISIAKTASKKSRALIRSMKFLSPEVINLPFGHAWNTIFRVSQILCLHGGGLSPSSDGGL